MELELMEVGARMRFWGQSRLMEKAGKEASEQGGRRGQPPSQYSTGLWLSSFPLSVQ